jgi:hypothetical protein
MAKIAILLAPLALLLVLQFLALGHGAAAQAPATTQPEGNLSVVIPTPSPDVVYTDPTIASRIDLIFSFFAEDRDSINSYTVTIAQLLKVPLRRIDFYNLPLNTVVPLAQRKLSNTPFGAKTMVRVTVQPALPTETTAPTAPTVRDNLMAASKRQNPALAAIFIDDANPIDISDDQIFSFSKRTVFDLMYTFVIATMGVAYIFFIGFVVSKIVKAYQYAKIEAANREREKELRKQRAKSRARGPNGAAAAAGADDDQSDDSDDVAIDASKWDDAGDMPGGGDDDIRDEDGVAVRTLVDDVTNMLRGEESPERSVRFGGDAGSSRRAQPSKNQRLIAELDRLALPPSGGGRYEEDL